MGHTTLLKPLAKRMVSLGHEVDCLAIRNEDAARHLPCPVEEAPWLRPPKRSNTQAPWIGHLADTLATLGWDQVDHLREAVGRWRAVLIEHKPDLVVMESAPTALLASQGLPMKRARLASHWNTPPRASPLPDLQTQLGGLDRPIPDTEPAVVTAINACLTEQHQPTIASLYELFDRVDNSVMLCIPEIDAHGHREKTEYLGGWGYQTGHAPPWPACQHGPNTPGVFAYLKPFTHRRATLQLLADTGLPVQVFTPELTSAEADTITAKNIELFTSPIDWIAKQTTTAFIVCHGSIGMTSRALTLGLPMLSIPTTLEQTAVTVRASQTGACIGADIQNITSIGSALEQMFSDQHVFKAAERMGKKYESFDPDQTALAYTDRLLALT